MQLMEGCAYGGHRGGVESEYGAVGKHVRFSEGSLDVMGVNDYGGAVTQ